ncbi:hypothetical protein AB0P21_09605 [Kribbella sp. NPDC056861]|uniref:hypothetical protein n=1 Tax=Kribbella sp. NPDC056861 TaxID=3154857 RepID=UPI0034460444
MHAVIIAEGTGRHPTCDPEFWRLQARWRARHRSQPPRPAPTITGPDINISRNHPATSHRMAQMVKGIRLDILRALRAHGPLTDYELEPVLRRSHQSISGGRRRCAIDGLVEDTGVRRPNRFGNNVIVWTITPGGIAASGG